MVHPRRRIGPPRSALRPIRRSLPADLRLSAEGAGARPERSGGASAVPADHPARRAGAAAVAPASRRYPGGHRSRHDERAAPAIAPGFPGSVSVLLLVPGSPRLPARGSSGTPEDVASDAPRGSGMSPSSARPRRRETRRARGSLTARGTPPRPPLVGRVRGPSFGEGDNFHRRKSADLREMRARGS